MVETQYQYQLTMVGWRASRRYPYHQCRTVKEVLSWRPRNSLSGDRDMVVFSQYVDFDGKPSMDSKFTIEWFLLMPSKELLARMV